MVHKKNTVHCQGCYFLGDSQVLRCGRLKKTVQGKDNINNTQILPCRRWCHGPLFFLHQFMHFLLLFLLHHSGKLFIPRDHLFLLIQILRLVLFKLLQRQDEMSIYGDIRVVFKWDRDSNHRLSLLMRADLPFVWNGFVAIYFWPSVSKSCAPHPATMRQVFCCYRWQVNTFQDIGMWQWDHGWCTI